ncbi:PREDICTED: putative leucine-rich repeat receptor-like protein kinase At2g19210 [Camelina sativa]|uniref:Leucine-rich repeat receptor-like protein kinase At2g19210 n=1 Tax=Camelina sativa TaxID=90675 RepID=A0ABM1R053_CAMSA|nr:PREDICTED: putative leucine-rich repeat receptor-like protein kinase At2g19210 [Camelina sativa]
MGHFNFLPLVSFTIFVLVVVLVSAQDQSGFVSIDCGIPEDSSYNDETTNIKYISDAAFVESGTNHSIGPEFQINSLEKQFYSLRSFPEGKRNCYEVKPTRGKGFKYLIRTRFMYGNYDNLGKAPEFDLYLGVNLWDSVKIDNATMISTKEIIHTLRSDHIHVCLVDKEKGTPFLSVLELRLLKNDTYETPYDSLMLYQRLDLGAYGLLPIRYKDDVYDRIWMPLRFSNHAVLNTSSPIDSNMNNDFQPANVVMSTASTPWNESLDIVLSWKPLDPTWKFYVYMHFAEVRLDFPRNETENNLPTPLPQFKGIPKREFSVFWNKTKLFNAFSPRFLYTDTLFTKDPVTGPKHEFSLLRTANSTFPPSINAMEIYRINEFLQLPTDQHDVDAIMNIKSKYGVKKNWLGDPCAPLGYPWPGISCSYLDNESPKIVSVNLTFSGLTGQIDPAFSNLTSLQKLDLSNNSLTGNVPEFLADLPDLKELNLEGNQFTGPFPIKLLERSNDGSLLLRFIDKPEACVSASCQNTNKKEEKTGYIIPLVASLAGLLVLLAALALFWLFRKKYQSTTGVKTGPLDSTKRYYKYSEVVGVTKNFQRVLGQGGFGKVYYGVLNGNQVAVKMLSESSSQGYKEFRAEVELLLRVHHKNLNVLIGYCNEDKHMALIYEYMANGTLGDYLSGKNSSILSWEERLQISLDAAQGLEYLHNGCKPPIVQRDVKPANILLNEKLQAKIADFGLSRSVALEGGSQVSTAVAGTIGYLDPEYHATQQLSEKSDVYSFGMVVLQVVTGQPVFTHSRTPENRHISNWVGLLLSKGDIRSIVDPRLEDRFDAGVAWKITEVAMACASQSSANRPTMSQVVAELKDSVNKARAIGGGSSDISPEESTNMVSIDFDSGMVPQPR